MFAETKQITKDPFALMRNDLDEVYGVKLLVSGHIRHGGSRVYYVGEHVRDFDDDMSGSAIGNWMGHEDQIIARFETEEALIAATAFASDLWAELSAPVIALKQRLRVEESNREDTWMKAVKALDPLNEKTA